MEQQKQSRITSWLSGAPSWQFSLYAIAVSFSTYFCMYGFRKAFSVARFEDQAVWIFDLKIALVISQIVGYTLAKYLGTKFCSEIQARNRALAILFCIAGAETALVLYGILPGGWILAAIFLNGLSLGGVWGLVYGFLEGRKVSEILGAGLSCSYIIASGYAKTVGKSWLDEGVSEVWMPALTGACYLPFLIVAVWFLKQIPPPSGADVAERVLRKPMDSKDRCRYPPGKQDRPTAFGRARWPEIARLPFLHRMRRWRELLETCPRRHGNTPGGHQARSRDPRTLRGRRLRAHRRGHGPTSRDAFAGGGAFRIASPS